ncbi:MAG: glycosyltransferase family 39 protein [bacterium]
MNDKYLPGYRSVLGGAGVFLWALFGRWLLLGRTGVWMDEAFSLYYASQPLDWLLKNAAGLINHPPGYFLLLKAWLSWTGSNQVLLELSSIVLSLLAIGLFYFLARELFTPGWALWLTALFAIHPFLIYYSIELRMYTLGLIGVIGSLWLILRLLDQSRLISWLGLLFFSLLSFYSHSLTVLYLIPGITVLGWTCYRRSQLGPFGWYCLGILVLYGPWFLQVVGQATRISSDFWIPPFHLADVVRLSLAWGGYTLPHDPGVLYGLGSTGVVVLFFVPLMFAYKARGSNGRFLSLLTVGLPLTVITAVSLYGQSVFLTRGFLFALPFVVILWGLGLRQLPGRLVRDFVVLFGVFLLLNTVRLHLHPPHRFLLKLSNNISSNYPAQTTLVHTSKRTFFPFKMVYGQNRNNKILGDQIRPFFPGTWEQNLRNLRKQYVRSPVLFVVYRSQYPHWKQLVNQLRSESRVVERTLRWDEKVFQLVYLPEGFPAQEDRLVRRWSLAKAPVVCPRPCLR